MPKLWKIARIVKGNKKSFESNDLTKGIAEKQAKSDFKKQKKNLTNI